MEHIITSYRYTFSNYGWDILISRGIVQWLFLSMHFLNPKIYLEVVLLPLFCSNFSYCVQIELCYTFYSD